MTDRGEPLIAGPPRSLLRRYPVAASSAPPVGRHHVSPAPPHLLGRHCCQTATTWACLAQGKTLGLAPVTRSPFVVEHPGAIAGRAGGSGGRRDTAGRVPAESVACRWVGGGPTDRDRSRPALGVPPARRGAPRGTLVHAPRSGRTAIDRHPHDPVPRSILPVRRSVALFVLGGP